VTIDWLTVGAQALNFLVLVYLLKRFLYGPIVRAMARREEAIVERLRQAERQKADAETEARQHREAREALEARRARLQARAREEAEDLRQTLEKELRHEIDELRERWRGELEREQTAFLRDVRRHAAEQFEALARRALGDLASAELEAQMTRRLIERLGALDGERRAALADATQTGEPVHVRSAFDLPATLKRSLTAALHDALGREVEVAYEHSDDVICGVEIRAGGQSLAWSLQGYLEALERRLAEGLAARTAARHDESR
jgi:F-type H+-transporting ATPase subunit b